MEDSEEKRLALRERSALAYYLKYSGRYLGPGDIVMKFKNFNPLKDPKFDASQYEDSFPDVGRKEMGKRLTERRKLFLTIYDRERPELSLRQYMKAAQTNEGYKYQPEVNAGPVSLFMGGSIPKHLQRGELPECQLLGFVNGEGAVGCMAHPLAETSQGYDGRDQVGFFNHTGCCRNVSCEASKEFRFLSTSAMKVFDKAVEGMSWYEYSRHATSVLVYYLRSYDHILQRLDESGFLDSLTLEQLVEFTNALYDEWPLRRPEWGERHPLNALRAPAFPFSDIEIHTCSLDWYTGATAEHEMLNSAELSMEVLLSLRSTDKGYRFTLMFPEGERGIDVQLKNGNEPVLVGAMAKELWRAGLGRSDWFGTALTKGKKALLKKLHDRLGNDETCMNTLDVLSTNIPLAERIMYLALGTWFLRDHFVIQLQQARDHVEKHIEAFSRELYVLSMGNNDRSK